MFRSPFSRRVSARALTSIAGLASLAGLVLLPSCSSNSSTSSTSATTIAPAGNVLRVSAMDDMFDAPTTIPAGMTTIELTNAGPSPHQVQLLRLHDGVTTAQAMAAAKAPNPGALLSMVDVAGGANVVGAKGTQSVEVDLRPGSYVEVCFVPDPDGSTHLAKGMISALTVTPHDDATPAPATIGAVTLDDFSFDLPNPFAGKGTLAVVNKGPQPHEMTILRLNDAATADDVTAFFTHPSGPPPFSYAGGMGALAPGQTGYLDLDLATGKYVAVCLVPDAKTHQPHIMLGMIKAFAVS